MKGPRGRSRGGRAGRRIRDGSVRPRVRCAESQGRFEPLAGAGGTRPGGASCSGSAGPNAKTSPHSLLWARHTMGMDRENLQSCPNLMTLCITARIAIGALRPPSYLGVIRAARRLLAGEVRTRECRAHQGF